METFKSQSSGVGVCVCVYFFGRGLRRTEKGKLLM